LLELLELGKITQSSIENSHIDVKEMVTEIIKGYENQPDFNRIQFQVSINHQYDIRSKKILLTVILQNLIDNAIKYKGEHDPRGVDKCGAGEEQADN
jgi:signal transduction histidine kinase